ncbi:MAG: hypothetical protein P8P74_08350 [Crocinitomicaceae bacterium]|nr:hypothetical protein [Crocinitomicaceae bacterium]
MNNFRKKKPAFILVIIALIFALPAVVMFLWNSILPDVTGVNTINYWQAMGIFVLSKILFGGFGPGRGPRGRNRKREKMKQRFMEMDAEEKSRFKEEWKKRCKTD